MEELLFFKNIFYCYLTWIITCEKIGWLAFHAGLVFYWFDNKLIPTQRLRLKLIFFNLKIFFNYIYLLFSFIYISNKIYVIKLIFYKLICRPWYGIKSLFFFTGDFFYTFTHKIFSLCKLSLGITLCCAKLLTIPVTFFFVFFLNYFESFPSILSNFFKWPLNRFYEFMSFFFLCCYSSFRLKTIRYLFFFYRNIYSYLTFWKYEFFFFFLLLLALVAHVAVAFLICFHLMFYLLFRNLIFFLVVCFIIIPFFIHCGYFKCYFKFCSCISFLVKTFLKFFHCYFLNGISFNFSLNYPIFLTFIGHCTSVESSFFFKSFILTLKKKI